MLLMPEIDHNWADQNYVCLRVTETDWVASLHDIFCVFLISLHIFTNVTEGAVRGHVTKSMV